MEPGVQSTERIPQVNPQDGAEKSTEHRVYEITSRVKDFQLDSQSHTENFKIQNKTIRFEFFFLNLP